VIEALTFPGSTIPRAADPDGEGPRYSAGLLYRYHGVEKAKALAVAGILQGAMIGATTSWLHSGASREVVEESLAAVIRALVGTSGQR
jgi:hypothetical protein